MKTFIFSLLYIIAIVPVFYAYDCYAGKDFDAPMLSALCGGILYVFAVRLVEMYFENKQISKNN